MPAPVNQRLARLLDGVAGLQPVSATSAFGVWRVSDLPARVRVVETTGTVVGLPSGPVGMSGVPAPAAGGTLELAEPAGGWKATLNGKPLTAVASSAGSWAQAFRLPPGGGVLDIGRNQAGRDLVLVLELVAVAVVAALAMPGSRTSAEGSAPAVASAGAAAGAGAAAAGRAAQVGEAAEGTPAAGGRRARGRAGRAARGPRREREAAAGPRRDRRGRPAARRRPAAVDTSPGGGPAAGPRTRVSWPGVEPEEGAAGSQAPWPEAGEQAGAGAPWPGDGEPGPPWSEAGPSGAGAPWPGDEAGAGVPWPGADGTPGSGMAWPSGEPSGWPAPQPSGWPAPQPSGWPDEGGDTLDPLPPAGPSRHRRPEPPGDEEPARWPVPEHDSGGDAW